MNNQPPAVAQPAPAAANAGAAAAGAAEPIQGITQLRLPTFYGTEDQPNVLAFLDCVETVQGGHNFDDVRIANFVRFAMQGKARKWLNTVREEDEENVLDWALLRPLFEARWLPPLSHEEAHTLQTALVQTDKMDVRDFWDECNHVQDRLKRMFPQAVRDDPLYVQMRRAMMISRFINGLKKEIRDVVLKARIQGHDQAAANLIRETAITAEMTLKKEKTPIANIAAVDGLDDQAQEELAQALAETKEQFIEAIQGGKYRTSNNFRGRPQGNRGRGNPNSRPGSNGNDNKANGQASKPTNTPNGGGWRAVNNNWRSNSGNGNGQSANNGNPKRNGNPKCGACLEAGHFMRECPMMAAFRKQHQGGKQLAAIDYVPSKEVATIEAADWAYQSTSQYPFC